SPAGTRPTRTLSNGTISPARSGSPRASVRQWRGDDAMGMHHFRLPDVGEGIAEAEIVAWHVAVGQTVKEDQPLVDVMTEKATVEIGAPVSGKVVERNGEAGDMVPVGSELVVIATDGADAKESAETGAPRRRETPEGRSPSPLAGEGRGEG